MFCGKYVTHRSLTTYGSTENMFLKGAVLLLLFFTHVRMTVSHETVNALKIGILLDHDIDEEPLRQTVEKVTEHYRPWLPQSRIVTIWRSLNSSVSTHATKIVHSLLGTDIRALVTALRCRQLKSVAVMVEQFNVPHVSVSLETCPTIGRGKFTIHLTTQKHSKYQLLLEIAMFVEWKRVNLIFDKSGDHHIQEVVLRLSQNGIESALNTLSPMPTWSSRSQNLVVIAPSVNLLGQMKLALDMKMLGADYWWTIFADDITLNKLNDIFTPYNSSNILLIKVKPRNMSEIVMFRGAPCIENDESFTPTGVDVFEALVLYRIALTNMGIIKGAGITYTEYPVNQFQSISGSSQLAEQLRRVCGSTEDQPGSLCTPSKMEYDLYSTKANSDALINVGKWNARNKLTTRENRLFLNSFADFGNSAIRIGVSSESEPFVSWDEDKNTYKGLIIDMVEDLAKILKFNYTFIEAPGGLFGHRLSNGSWTGLIGMVARREVEFAAAHLTVSPERSEVVDFTTPFMQDSLGILTPKPKEETHMFQVFKPFSVSVWLTFVAFVFAAFIMLIIISVKIPPRAAVERSLRNFVAENVFLIISSCFEQGPTFHPTSVSARCFLTFWFVFSLLMMTMYTAHLAAVLTVSTPLKPINTLQDLVDQPDMKILVHYGSNTWSQFSESDNPVYRKVGQRMEKYKQSVDPIINGRYSFVTDRSFLEYLAITNCGDIRLADERFQSFSLAFAVPKKSIYKEAVDLSIQKMVESGLIVKLKRKWWTSLDCSRERTEAKALVLSLDRVGGIFIVYIGVCVVAAFGLLGEHVFCKYFR